MSAHPIPLRLLPWGWLLLLWMCVIFFFSSLPGTPGAAVPTWDFILERKGAHVFEYFVLTLLAFAFFAKRFGREGFGRVLWTAALFSLMYAATDELHQFFTPLRGAKLSDVGIDLIGITLALLVIHAVRRRKKQ